MNIEFKKEPFEHFIITNVFLPDQKESILSDLDDVRKHVFPSQETKSHSAKDPKTRNSLRKSQAWFIEEGTPLDKIGGITLDYMKQFLSDGFIKIVDETKDISIFKYYILTNYPSYLISYYEDNDNYDTHWDMALITNLTWLNKEPKNFEGGDLFFDKYNYKIEYESNKTVIFPSVEYHRVGNIKMKNKEVGGGRYCITNFCSFVPTSNTSGHKMFYTYDEPKRLYAPDRHPVSTKPQKLKDEDEN